MRFLLFFSFLFLISPALAKASISTPLLPKPPALYHIPSGATPIASSDQLNAALADGKVENLVLADGIYTNSTAFKDPDGDSIYAFHLGKVIIGAGIEAGGNFGAPGATFQGLVLAAPTLKESSFGAEIHTWGKSGTNVKILDSVFQGSWKIAAGIDGFQPQGLVVRRCRFFNFTDEALRASSNVLLRYGALSPRIEAISDLYIDGVSRTTPGSSSGTAEAGLWVGHPVLQGVKRISVRNAAISGIEVVNNSWNTLFQDITVDMSGPRQAAGVCIYVEHFSYHDKFSRFRLTGCRVGINLEWADPSWGGVAASHYLVIENGYISSMGSTLGGNQVGVYADQGSEATTITNVKFAYQNWAGVGIFKNVGKNVFRALDCHDLSPSAKCIQNAHP